MTDIELGGGGSGGTGSGCGCSMSGGGRSRRRRRRRRHITRKIQGQRKGRGQRRGQVSVHGNDLREANQHSRRTKRRHYRHSRRTKRRHSKSGSSVRSRAGIKTRIKQWFRGIKGMKGGNSHLNPNEEDGGDDMQSIQFVMTFSYILPGGDYVNDPEALEHIQDRMLPSSNEIDEIIVQGILGLGEDNVMRGDVDIHHVITTDIHEHDKKIYMTGTIDCYRSSFAQQLLSGEHHVERVMREGDVGDEITLTLDTIEFHLQN
jgi:hypothetical protein